MELLSSKISSTLVELVSEKDESRHGMMINITPKAAKRLRTIFDKDLLKKQGVVERLLEFCAGLPDSLQTAILDGSPEIRQLVAQHVLAKWAAGDSLLLDTERSREKGPQVTDAGASGVQSSLPPHKPESQAAKKQRRVG